jgi:hypothetical protein
MNKVGKGLRFQESKPLIVRFFLSDKDKVYLLGCGDNESPVTLTHSGIYTMRINSRKNMAQAAFIEGKVMACRKAGSIVFEIDEARKGGITAAELVDSLCRRNIAAMASSCGGSSIWRITACVERKAAA